MNDTRIRYALGTALAVALFAVALLILVTQDIASASVLAGYDWA